MANKEIRISCAPRGCLSLIVFIFILAALFYKLPTPWGTIEIDVFPPGLYIDR